MDSYCGTDWFAIHTQRFRETVAASSVSSLGVEVFLPMAYVDPRERAVIKTNSRPLFPSYFFARFNSEISLSSVESSRGVLYVIKSGTCPIAVEEAVISDIQSRVEADGLIRLQTGGFKPGDQISIQAGPFEGMMGRVEAEVDDRRRVAILLETLWNARVVIEKQWVKAAAV